MLRAAQTTVFMATVFMVFVSMGEASAQSTAPGTASDIAQDDRGMAPWPWIIIGLVMLGAVILGLSASPRPRAVSASR